MSSLDVDSLFTNTFLEETIDICCDILLKKTDIYEGYSKSEFKTLSIKATKICYFRFTLSGIGSQAIRLSDILNLKNLKTI